MNSQDSGLSRTDIEQVVLEAIRTINLSRRSEERLDEGIDAALYGEGSVLDSLGLVALLIEVEEALRDKNVEVALSDEKALSQKHSPFRTVRTLVDYIHGILTSQHS